VIHVSSDDNDARREIKLWFEPSELLVDLYPAQDREIQKLTKKCWI
jgi:hypothetical protein